MLAPLPSLGSPPSTSSSSLGESLNDRLSKSSIRSLIDCLSDSSLPAIFHPDPNLPPLLHDELRSFVLKFSLPHSINRPRLGRNDRVMLVVPAGPENALALLALCSYHSVAPINASCTLSELVEDASRLNAKAIVTTKDVAKRLNLLQESLDCDVICLQSRATGNSCLFDLSLMGNQGKADHLQVAEPHGLDDISLILHTSGTTGKKKVVRYSLRTLLVGTWCVLHSWRLTPGDRNLNMMPLFHVGGIVRNLLAPILSGGSTIMCHGFDPTAFWMLASELKATWYYAAPTIHHAILTNKPDNIDSSRDLRIRMICNGAGTLLPSLALQLRDGFSGAIVLPSYGTTECMPISTPKPDYELDRPGCSGIACGPYLSIRDSRNLECELLAGSVGAVCVRGLPTFGGYEVSPDASSSLDTSAFTSEGWFDSGDLGYLDSDGYLFITGRSKEIINKGGEVISPYEVEEAIATVAKEHLMTSLVFSVEHDVLQETIGVVVVSVHDSPCIGLQQLHELLKGNLHPSKWPFVIVYMDDIPMNSAGKPLRIGLAQRLGIEMMSDSVPLLHRHFDAQIPEITASLTEPIPCSRVLVLPLDIEKSLHSIPDIQDVGLRIRSDESIDIYLSVTPQSSLTSNDVLVALSRHLPGYAMPNCVEVLHQPLLYKSSGELDFEGIALDVCKNLSLNMSKTEQPVRDIVAELLTIDPQKIRTDSDFFLLGGNSLLLGKLSHRIRKQFGVNVGIVDLFSESTIDGIASLIEEKNCSDMNFNEKADSEETSSPPMKNNNPEGDYERNLECTYLKGSRGQTHLLCLVIQAIPFLFLHPLRAALTWTMLLSFLSYLRHFSKGGGWDSLWILGTAVAVAHLVSGIICPLGAITLKWLIIGRYKPGVHRMWTVYYLRYWFVTQALRIGGRGIFDMNNSMILWYYRLLGAKIGDGVHLDEETQLHECDLLTLKDGCRIDAESVRAFSVEREGFFRLEPITIGTNAIINCYTNISPGADIPDGAVYGPHSSSFNKPHPPSYAAYNQTLLGEPWWILRIFVAWPIILLVISISYIPWILAIRAMIGHNHLSRLGQGGMETVIYWFASSERLSYYFLARILRNLASPLLQVVVGLLVKRLLGLNREDASQLETPSQIALLRRYINSVLLSKTSLCEAFSIVGTHYELVSIAYRAMGAKVGKGVYWPGSGIKCTDPELLEIGDDVVFGSRSTLMTTDGLGSGKITIENGANVSDHVVLLPGVTVGRQAVMGSGALAKRDTYYEAGSIWLGNVKGEAVCLTRGSREKYADEDTVKPFRKAFYNKEANYFVYPYPMVILFGVIVTSLSSAYWSMNAVVAAQVLRQLLIHLASLRASHTHWYHFAIFYGVIAACFSVVLSIQGLIAMFWVIITKWLILGRRREGHYNWDRSSYCQRWQLTLVSSQSSLYLALLSLLNGSAYIVWYLRALGGKIGNNCAVWAGCKSGVMTEPDLVELGDNVSLDTCDAVAHINSRGEFSLNRLKIGNGCAMRAGSRLLSGASMEESSMLCEHTLLTSGEIADAGEVYTGWPGNRVEEPFKQAGPAKYRL